MPTESFGPETLGPDVFGTALIGPELPPEYEAPKAKKGFFSTLFGGIKHAGSLSDLNVLIRAATKNVQEGKPLIEPRVTVKSFDLGLQPIFLVAIVVVAFLLLRRGGA